MLHIKSRLYLIVWGVAGDDGRSGILERISLPLPSPTALPIGLGWRIGEMDALISRQSATTSRRLPSYSCVSTIVCFT